MASIARIDPVGTGTSLRFWQGNNSGAPQPLHQQLHRLRRSVERADRRLDRRHAVVHSALRNFPRRHPARRRLSGRRCPPAGAAILLLRTDQSLGNDHWRNARVRSTWYVTNSPATQNMTKQTLGNRSFINQVKYSPQAIKRPRSSAPTTATCGSVLISAQAFDAVELGECDRGQHRPAQPPGPWHCLRSDVAPTISPSAMRRSADSTQTRRRRPATFSKWSATTDLRLVHLERTRLATSRISRSTRSSPIRSSRSRSSPGPTGACTTPTTSPRRTPTWSRFENGLPHAMIWDMQYRSRLYHPLRLDARPRRLCLAAAFRSSAGTRADKRCIAQNTWRRRELRYQSASDW